MPDRYCRKCGSLAQPADLYCRVCGSSLEAATSGKPRRPWRTTCLVVAAGMVVLVVALLAVFILLRLIQPGGIPAVSVEIIGTTTPYPTRPSYRTATPYNQTPTAYPTRDFYPTTGALATPLPTATSPGTYAMPEIQPYRSFFDSSCELTINNQFNDLDSVVMLVEADTDLIVTSAYVRARDSYSTSGLTTGTYYTYVALGQDWDSVTRLFTDNASYYRFTAPVVFTTCSFNWSPYSGYQYLTVTLNTTEGAGLDITNLLPSEFPGATP
jgi:hypothetical protein